MTFSIIPPQVPFTDAQGRIAREWYQFLLNIFKQIGSGSLTTTDPDLQSLVMAATRQQTTSVVESAIRELAAAVHQQRSASIDDLRHRIQDLESRMEAMPTMRLDYRVADLQAYLFDKR